MVMARPGIIDSSDVISHRPGLRWKLVGGLGRQCEEGGDDEESLAEGVGHGSSADEGVQAAMLTASSHPAGCDSPQPASLVLSSSLTWVGLALPRLAFMTWPTSALKAFPCPRGTPRPTSGWPPAPRR